MSHGNDLEGSEAASGPLPIITRDCRCEQWARAYTELEADLAYWRLRAVSHQAASMLAVERMELDAAAAKRASKERDVFERAAVQASERVSQLEAVISDVSPHCGIELPPQTS